MTTMGIDSISVKQFLSKPTSNASLAGFRIVFGALMIFSLIRFAAYGWIEELYISPDFHFTYYGFSWVQSFGNPGMYVLFGVCGLAAFAMMLGLYYRISSVLFFLSFAYIELIDKANYLNHYFFITVIAFLMMLLPAHKAWSLDVIRKPKLLQRTIPYWMVFVLILQLSITYFFAGVAKLNSDWLFEALPLKIWLPTHAEMPIVGSLLSQEWTAYVFSWFGAIYDLSIPFLLFWKRSRPWAYIAVIVFHVMTAMLFQIGVFPYVMILATLVFFSPQWFEKIFGLFSKTVQPKISTVPETNHSKLKYLLIGFFVLQFLIPFRYLMYPGKLFWNEEGYRFSWRVMLMEKAGAATFFVGNDTNGWSEIYNGDYLTRNQEKMMASQPDMLLEFAHYLKEIAEKEGGKLVEVKAEVYVSLNGENSRLFVDKNVNLSAQKRGFKHKDWILPY